MWQTLFFLVLGMCCTRIVDTAEFTCCYLHANADGSLGDAHRSDELHRELTAALEAASVGDSDPIQIKKVSWFDALQYNVDYVIAELLRIGCDLVFIADRGLLLPPQAPRGTSIATAGAVRNLSALSELQQRATIVLGFAAKATEMLPLDRFVVVAPYCNNALMALGYMAAAHSGGRCVAYVTHSTEMRRDELVAFASGALMAAPSVEVMVVEVDRSRLRCGSAVPAARQVHAMGCKYYIGGGLRDAALVTALTALAPNVTVLDYGSGAIRRGSYHGSAARLHLELDFVVVARQLASAILEMRHVGPSAPLPTVLLMGCTVFNSTTIVPLTSLAPDHVMLPWCVSVAPGVVRCTDAHTVINHEPLYALPPNARLVQADVVPSLCAEGQYEAVTTGDAHRCLDCPVGSFSAGVGKPCVQCVSDPTVGPGATACPDTGQSTLAPRDSGFTAAIAAASVAAVLVVAGAVSLLVWVKHQRTNKTPALSRRSPSTATGGWAPPHAAGDASVCVHVAQGGEAHCTLAAIATRGDDGLVGAGTPASHQLTAADTVQQRYFSQLVREGQYQQAGLIGKGAGASVYAVVTPCGRTLAMKHIAIPTTASFSSAQRRRQRAENEMKMVACVSSPYCVKYYALRCTSAAVLLFMEYVPGLTLRAFVAQLDGPLLESAARRFATHLVRGVAAMHAQRILHRDLKCANALVSAEGVVKICDFGAAISADEPPNNQAAGTPVFMSPELARLQLEPLSAGSDGGGFSFASDVWALGITVAEMCLGGELPFSRRCVTAMDAFRLIADDSFKLVFPPGASRGMSDFVKRCCHADPAERPAAAKLLEDPWLVSE